MEFEIFCQKCENVELLVLSEEQGKEFMAYLNGEITLDDLKDLDEEVVKMIEYSLCSNCVEL